jgi:hypothetical protein
MPSKKVVEEMPTQEESAKIKIETTPTPSASEDEEEVNMKTIANEEKPKKKTKEIEKEPTQELTKTGRPKKPLSEARIAQLNAMKEAKKKKYDDYKESQAVLFLSNRGYSVNDKTITKELKKAEAKKNEAKTIHLKEEKPVVKPVNTPVVVKQPTVQPTVQPVRPVVQQSTKPYTIRKPYNPYAE